MSIHDGHRQRIKERFLKNGLDGFSEHEVLELLLFYCIPRRDTNEIAHRLEKRFGSLTEVIEAPVKELKKVDGVGENAAMFLSVLKETNRYLNICRARENKVLRSIGECGEYLRHFFDGIRNEVVYLLCMDAKGMVIDCYKVGEGGVNSASVSIRKIIDIAITSNATSVVLAHNHPSGLAIPSADDIQTTRRLAKALYMADVILTDHIVVADKDYISMSLSGIYDPADISVED